MVKRLHLGVDAHAQILGIRPATCGQRRKPASVILMVTGSPDDKPAFLDPARADSIGYVGAPPDAIPLFDDELVAENPDAPSPGIIDRYREIARRHAHGQTNNQICAALGYTPSRMSIILTDPFVQTEIAKWRKAFFDGDAISRLKEAARDGASRIHSIILDPNSKESAVLEASKFAIEKTHGKARQEVTVESGTLTSFMEMLKQMRESGTPLKDVTPGSEPAQISQAQASDAEQPSKFDSWLDEHLAP